MLEKFQQYALENELLTADEIEGCEKVRARRCLSRRLRLRRALSLTPNFDHSRCA